MSCILLPVTLL